MMRKAVLIIGVAVTMVTLSSFSFAQTDPTVKNKALFDGIVQKLYGGKAEKLENDVKKMHQNRDRAIEEATSEDTIDSDMGALKEMGEKVLNSAEAMSGDPKKIEMMKSTLPPELQAKLDGTTPQDAIEMGMMQVLDMFRDMSQYQVENYLKLAWVQDPTDQNNFFVRNPKVITYTARVLRDKDAIPAFFTITKQKMKLMFFLVFVVASFILSKLLVKFYNRNVSFIVAIARFFVRTFTFFSLRIIFFCYLFYDQMAPMGTLVRSFIIDYFST